MGTLFVHLSTKKGVFYMTIYEKAKELGEMISESQELQNLRFAEETIINNQDALDIFNDFSAIREEYASLMAQGEDGERLEQVKRSLIEKNEALMENHVTKSYIDSKNTVDNIFKTVTDILMRAVNGAEEESQGGGCSSGGCSGCSCGG
jgi:cell fate (sporulation/competence/biofilm development) regulator YlbF (YheA/YmcA/DUF963 family)